jgi:protein-tyrosine phosphatase
MIMNASYRSSVPRRAAVGMAAAVTVIGSAVTAPAVAAPATHDAAGRITAPASHGAIPFTAVDVAAGDTAGSWTVSVAAPGVDRVRVFVGDSARSTGGKPVTLKLGHGAGSVTVSSDAVRPWVKLVPDHGAPLTVAARHLDVDGVLNFRDIGGYRTTDGRWVRDGLVYRTAALTATGKGAALLDRLGITGDYDLRTTGEITAAPDTVPAGARYRNLDVMGDGNASMPQVTTPEQMRQYMRDIEPQLVDSGSAKAGFRSLVEGLTSDKGAGLYHCTAGKDRTGWATAVLLTLLGVDRTTVMDDYLLSNRYYFEAPETQAQLAALPEAQRAVYTEAFKVDASYLQAGLDRVGQEYGSMYGYVTKGLGVSPATVARLKAKMLTGTAAHS